MKSQKSNFKVQTMKLGPPKKKSIAPSKVMPIMPESSIKSNSKQETNEDIRSTTEIVFGRNHEQLGINFESYDNTYQSELTLTNNSPTRILDKIPMQGGIYKGNQLITNPNSLNKDIHQRLKNKYSRNSGFGSKMGLNSARRSDDGSFLSLMKSHLGRSMSRGAGQRMNSRCSESPLVIRHSGSVSLSQVPVQAQNF